MIDSKHVAWLVYGATLEHFLTLNEAPDNDKVGRYAGETLDVVMAYLRGERTLDGTCTDFQCHIAIEAERVFGPRASDCRPAPWQFSPSLVLAPA